MLAACGGSSGSSHPGASPTTTSARTTRSTATAPVAGSLGVRPSAAHPRSEIAFAFTARDASGVHGKIQLGYSLSVTGPSGAGCSGSHEAAAPKAGAHQRVGLTLGPAELDKPWCPGAYTARVFELQRAACKTSAPCPQYIRVVGIIARGTFRVAGS